MDGWNTTFLLGMPIFRCYVSFREGNLTTPEHHHHHHENKKKTAPCLTADGTALRDLPDHHEGPHLHHHRKPRPRRTCSPAERCVRWDVGFATTTGCPGQGVGIRDWIHGLSITHLYSLSQWTLKKKFELYFPY